MNVFELFGTIAIKNRDANEAIKDTTEKAERSAKRIQVAFKKIGEATIKVGKVAMAVGAAWAATIETSRNYRTAMAQLDTAFLANGHSSETALKTYKALQAVLGDTDKAVEASTALAQMVKNEEDLNKWTNICTGAFAMYQGKLPIEGLTEAANETAKVGVVTGNLADALNWAGISEDDFNLKLKACRTEQERQDLIMNTLYWTYKDAADQYRETGKSVMEANAAQEKLNAAMAELGRIGEPIMTKIKTKVADMVTAAVPHLENMITSVSNLATHWNQFALNLALGYDDIVKRLEQLALDLAKGWDEVVLPAIKDLYKVTFGVDMPSWEDIVSSITDGWQYVKKSIAGLFNIDIGWSTGSFGGGGNGTSSAEHGRTIPESNAEGDGAIPKLARGLAFVPRDDFRADLHYGEAVLTRAQADVWRRGGAGSMVDSAGIKEALDRLYSVMITVANNTGSGHTIMLDSGILAGQLMPAIDAGLGQITARKRRGG